MRQVVKCIYNIISNARQFNSIVLTVAVKSYIEKEQEQQQYTQTENLINGNAHLNKQSN